MDAFQREITHKSKKICIHKVRNREKRETQDCICLKGKKRNKIHIQRVQCTQSIDKNKYTRNCWMFTVFTSYTLHLCRMHLAHTYKTTIQERLLYTKYKRNQENCMKTLVKSFGRETVTLTGHLA